jgi:hypothetical protein
VRLAAAQLGRVGGRYLTTLYRLSCGTADGVVQWSCTGGWFVKEGLMVGCRTTWCCNAGEAGLAGIQHVLRPWGQAGMTSLRLAHRQNRGAEIKALGSGSPTGGRTRVRLQIHHRYFTLPVAPVPFRRCTNGPTTSLHLLPHPAIAQARLLLLASPNLRSLCLTQPHHPLPFRFESLRAPQRCM